MSGRILTTLRLNSGRGPRPGERLFRELHPASARADAWPGLVGISSRIIVLRPPARITGRHYFAIFALAAATLSYQILITRFFSVMLYYHFAFAAVSLAMLGLTRGAMLVYKDPDRYAPNRVGMEFAHHAAWFAITGAGAMIAFLCVPLVVPADYVMVALGIATVAFVKPFTESGVCITL